MIPYEVDPSLHSDKPEDSALGDGFSRPTAVPVVPRSPLPESPLDGRPNGPLDPLGEKSGF